jgi:hypothetical protein
MGSNLGMALHQGVPLDWATGYCNKEFFKEASTNTLWMLNFMNVWMKKKLKKSHQNLTHVGVEPTTLYFKVHCSTTFTITFCYTQYIFLC